MKRLRFVIAVFILVCGLAAGCAVRRGMENSPQAAQGGVSAVAENINIKDIDIAKQSGDTVVTFSLLSGSRKAGYSETKLSQLPAYQIRLLGQPHRLMVTFDNIGFWDYEKKASWAASDLIMGLFREVPADSDSLTVFIQLSRSAAFCFKEEEGSLIVTLTPGDENKGTKYFCVSDSFFEHQEGRWPEAIDMQPVLCSDLSSRLLISQPFETKEEALGYMQSIAEPLKAALPNAALSVVGVAKNALPGFSADIDYSAVESRGVLMKDGSLLKTSVLLENGRYLAAAPDGRIAFSRSYKPDSPSLVQDGYLMSEKLWLLDKSGRAQNIGVSGFFLIVKAAFSPDGSYLALLDSSIENSVLYVYAFDSNALINLGEEGFGSQTADFAWSDTEDTLYAMTGSGETRQMRACRFAEDGGFAMQAVEELAGADGSVAVCGGRLFFADKSTGDVYEIGETRRKITTGADILARADQSKLLVLEAQASRDEQVLTGLKLVDIGTGETQVIASNSDIVDFGFMPDGRVYYLDAMIGHPAEGYPYGLYVYDPAKGAPAMLALCGTDEFAVSDSGVLYFIDYLGEAGNGFYATYSYDLSLE